MNSSRSIAICSMLVLTCCLLLIPLAFAQEETRKVFVFDNCVTTGKITNTKGIFWRETFDKGDKKHFYVEIGRNKNYIELYDDSQEITLRVYSTATLVMQEKDEKFVFLYKGKWEK